MELYGTKRRCLIFLFKLHILWASFTVTQADENKDVFSKSVANFLRIKQELKGRIEKPINASVDGKANDITRRADVLNPAHEGWNGHWYNHVKTQEIPDFGHHEIHTMDERGESFHLDSSPRHHVHHGHHGHHHMPHYHHEVHTFHHEGEHPYINHEHYVHHEPMHHHIPIMHHGGHHFDHHDDDEESGDHEEHHDDETAHGDTDDWDVGGGYFQLEEHGSDVNIVALKKHGSKVHMSGGDFNVIRDPWRHHSLFAGLFHPHEMPGHGHFPMEQFHQHFTYIANDRAINHHVYEHHTHNEDNHIHEHDPGHEHDYFYHHPPEPNNHGGKREYEGSLPINVTTRAQVKQEITNPVRKIEEIITIPLSFGKTEGKNEFSGPNIVPQEVPGSNSAVKSQILSSYISRPSPEYAGPYVRHGSLPVITVADPRSKSEPHVEEKEKELPKGKSPRFSPFNGNRIGPKFIGKTIEMPFAPIFKRSISAFTADRTIPGMRAVRMHTKNANGIRSMRLRKAFLGKLLLSKNAS